MTAMLPPGAPFASDELVELGRILSRATPLQRAWLAGFLSGLDAASAERTAEAPLAVPAASAAEPLLVLYASESGNAERLAAEIARAARGRGFRPRVVDFADLDLAELAATRRLVVVASTWGEGDPPARAVPAFQDLMSDAAPRLDGVAYGVLALGDRAYVNFCATGRALDERLAALGGRRAVERAECDLDYAEAAARWTGEALAALAPPVAAAPSAIPEPAATDDAAPRAAEVLERINLNSSRSDKQTWHLELGFDGPLPGFEPGDALDLFPENDPAAVDAVLAAAGLDGDDALRRTCVADRDVTTLSLATLETFVVRTGHAAARAQLADGAREWLAGRQLIDLLEAFPARLSADDFAALTRPLAPRAYSIASSRRAEPDAIHLLVGRTAWRTHGRDRVGVASGFVADRLKPGARVTVRLRPNRHFRPPEPGTDAIMIGAGTGIAPFRAFVQARASAGAAGRNWLIFGDRRFTHDFLYQTEWRRALQDGALDRLDLAFSRDQPEKIYVQHRIRERARDLVDWIEGGARLYVCGDAAAMAKDVRRAVVDAFAEARALSPDAAEQAVRRLERERRYLQDVY